MFSVIVIKISRSHFPLPNICTMLEFYRAIPSFFGIDKKCWLIIMMPFCITTILLEQLSERLKSSSVICPDIVQAFWSMIW